MGYIMLSKSSKWELGFVHYIAKFTTSRFVISRFECKCCNMKTLWQKKGRKVLFNIILKSIFCYLIYLPDLSHLPSTNLNLCIEISKICFSNYQLFTFGNKMHTYKK